jgi:rare lipoprotein A (peptidoglycan hydrolase)
VSALIAILAALSLLASGSAPDPGARMASAQGRTEASISGTASWYRTPGLTAAAGPRLRALLGPDWRGATVHVCAPQRGCVAVRLTDFCQCHRGERGERIIDLSDGAFSRLAPLAVGLVRVRVAAVAPPATDVAP